MPRAVHPLVDMGAMMKFHLCIWHDFYSANELFRVPLFQEVEDIPQADVREVVRELPKLHVEFVFSLAIFLVTN